MEGKRNYTMKDSVLLHRTALRVSRVSELSSFSSGHASGGEWYSDPIGSIVSRVEVDDHD